MGHGNGVFDFIVCDRSFTVSI